MRRLIPILLVGAVILAGLVLASPAVAQPSPKGPERVETSRSRPLVTAHRTLGRCRTVWAGRVKRSTAGIVVWRYRQTIRYCWRRNRLTYVARWRWGKTYLDCCWHFRRHIDNSVKRNARWSYKAFTQGKFEFCWPSSGICVSSRDPWIRMTVYGNGGWSHKTG